MNKPLIIVRNKTDLQPLGGLSDEDMNLTVIGAGGEPSDDDNILLTMSTLTEEGVISVKNAACERLLIKGDCLNRLQVAVPKPRDQKERPACIPRQKKLKRDLEEQNGGAGDYSASLKKQYILAHEEWKEDNMPEILDGHNDFVDPDVLETLEELEREEGLRLEQEGDEEDVEMNGKELTPEEKNLLIQQPRSKKSTAKSRPTVPRNHDKNKKFTSQRMGRQISTLDIDPSKAFNRARSKSIERGRTRESSRGESDVDAMEMDDDRSGKKLRLRSQSRPSSRSSSRQRGEIVPGEGYRDAGTIPTLRPKHLFSGKREVEKTDRFFILFTLMIFLEPALKGLLRIGP
ncbi:hypothetical protein MKW94_027269 [Papaver nudicaule]|uniref:NOG C-terminal domain-containing protein n=1 Tax=Papaver nudicaule TaxID=74823 RepID=A0AA41SEC8_PAPNU|nr:hypothetical protein [Papaver nudicaule]MCL7038798.1 hypothetical protein [Papaver nudicaule]